MSTDPEKKDIWFPAKRYGYGWGLPCAWQGWVFMIGWMAATIVGSVGLIFLINPAENIGAFYAVFLGFVAVMVVIIFLVCRAKGEPARWRWGGEQDDE